MARRLKRTWPVPPPPRLLLLRQTRTLLLTCTHAAAPTVTALTTFTSTGDSPSPPEQPNGEANDPDATSLRPLPEEPVPPTPEEVKEQGNEAFKSKNYTKAIDLYTQAIGEDVPATRIWLFVAYLDLLSDQICLRAMNRRILQTERPHICPSSDSNQPLPTVNRPHHCKRIRHPRKRWFVSRDAKPLSDPWPLRYLRSVSSWA